MYNSFKVGSKALPLSVKEYSTLGGIVSYFDLQYQVHIEAICFIYYYQGILYHNSYNHS